MKNERYKGIALIISSAVFFALMGAFVKLAGDIPSIQKSFFRNFVALVFSAGVLWKRRIPVSWPKGTGFALWIRCGLGTVALLANFYALDHLLLADATILNRMDPFFCVLFSALFLKERFTPFQAATVVGAFIGSVFIIKPTFANLNLVPSLIAFLGGICAGAAFTAIRYLGNRRVQAPVIVFCFSLFSTLVTFPYLIAVHHPMALWQLALLVCAGLAATVAQFSVTLAYRYAPAREISVYTYTQVMTSALLGFFLFDQVPDWLSLIGYLMVCAMAVALFVYNRRKEPALEAAESQETDSLGQ